MLLMIDPEIKNWWEEDGLEQPGKKRRRDCCVVGEESDEEDEKIRFYFSKILKIKTYKFVFYFILKNRRKKIGFF